MSDLTREHFEPSLPLADRRIVVDAESRRIAVRVASFDDVHSGHPGKVRFPRQVNVESAHVGIAKLSDGSDLSVAQLPMGTLHAAGGLSADEARQVYENTGRSVARVRYSVDAEGIRADGVLYDDVDEPTMDRLVASAPSGDWRTMAHLRNMEDFEGAPADFVGAAIVNLPGYSGTFAQEAARPVRLVASADSLLLIDEGDDVATTDEADKCAGDTPCPSCTCERSGEAQAPADDPAPAADEPATDEPAGDGEALTAAAGDGGEGADRVEMLEQRIVALEELVARAITAM